MNLFKCTKAELNVQCRGKSTLMFLWDDMNFPEARMLMDTFEEYHFSNRHGKSDDWSKPLNKRIRKMFPNCKISFMDVPYNLYGDENNWFEVFFQWEPEHFSWRQVIKAQRAVKKMIVPLIKHPFKPMEQNEA